LTENRIPKPYSSEMNTVEKEIIKATVSLLKEKPLYAHIFQQLEKVYVGNDHPIKTMAVGLNADKKRIVFYVNERYVETIMDDVDYQEIVCKSIEHEIIHLIFKHIFDDVRNLNLEKVNIAMDISCNQFIPNHPNTWYSYHDFDFPSNRTWKWYYNHLPGGKNGKNGKKEKTEHSLWAGSEEKTDASSSSITKEIVDAIIRRSVEDAKQTGYGNMNFNIVQELEKFMIRPNNTQNWKALLRSFVANSTETYLETTKMRISKRYGTRPGLINRSRLNLACTIDTSISISDRQIEKFINEINCICKNDVDVTIIEADIDVQNHYRYSGKFSTKIHGRGGTDFNPAIKFVEENGFDAHVYFTDFIAGKVTEKFKTPILWMLTGKIDKASYPCKKGRVVVMEEKDV